MSSIQSTASWRQLASTIRVATGHDLEIALLPLLRVFWRDLIRPRSMKEYDTAGVDLLAHASEPGPALQAVIQCKGFFASEGLVASHHRQIRESIGKFRDSPLTCRDYVLIHNLDGRNRVLAGTIDDELRTLIETGKALSVRQWDRDVLLRELESALRARMRQRIREQSHLMLSQVEGLFEQGNRFVEVVPIRDSTLRLRPGSAARIDASPTDTGLAVRLADVIGNPGTHRWTLLTGLFGSGKTSATLHAAAARPDGIIYVPAGSIQPRRGESGTNVVMSRILEALHVYSDEIDDEEPFFRRLSGPILRAMLSSESSSETLIIDALDENRSLQGPVAMTQFASSLAELRCNVVLTTRTEHFNATFGNFDHLFNGLSWKGGGIRDIRLIELAPWTDEQIILLVEDAAVRNPRCAAFTRLIEDIRREGTGGWSREMLAHPFFLRMIVDLVAEGVDPSIRRAEILADWSRSKLRRDLRSDRITPVEVTDRDSFLEQIEAMMCRVAGEMVIEDGGLLTLADTIPSTQLMEIGAESFPHRPLDLGTILSVTLLVPVTMRSRGSVPVRFSHRAFQEFYLARQIHRSGADVTRYPDAVRSLWLELATSRLTVEPGTSAITPIR